MADYYTQFAVELRLQSMEELKWVSSLLETLGKAEELLDESRDTTDTMAPGLAYADEALEILGGEHEFNVQTHIMPSGDNALLLLYSAESGDVDQAARLVQQYLQTFEPAKHARVPWASTCSKPRTSGFGGGVLLVTADWIYDPGEYETSQLASIAEAHSKCKVEQPDVPTVVAELRSACARQQSP